MFEKPSIFKVPTINSNCYGKEACGIFVPVCTVGYSSNCSVNYSNGSSGSTGSNGSTGVTEVVSDAIGAALSVVGSTASVVALT